MQDERFITLLFRGIKNKLKELFNLLFKFFLIFLVIIVSVSVLTKMYSETDETKRTLLLSGLTTEYTDYCYTNNLGDTKTLEKINDFINDQPVYVKSMFFEQEWRIVITKNISTEFIDSVNILGSYWENIDTTNLKRLTVPETKIIYLSNKNINSDELYNNFVHEFGHFYDYINGYVSMTYKFEEIYKMNKYSNLYTKEEKENATEFFTASYALYKTEPLDLEDDSPDVYNYINKIEMDLANRSLKLNTGIKFLMGTAIQIKIFIKDIAEQVTDIKFI